MEARDTYDASYENESLRKFLAGEPDDLPWMQSWLDMVREATAEGRRFARVRVVTLPLTGYSRFGVWCAQFTNGAGEDIRYLERGRAQAGQVPNHDYWLFDSRKLVRMHFGDHDVFLGGEVIDDPSLIVGITIGVMPRGTTPFGGTILPHNRASDVSNVHEARNALGKRLRELRLRAGLSGRELAESLSWARSKVSKLENGHQTPTDSDIRAWTGATGSGNEAESLLVSLHTLEVQHADWQRILRSGVRPHQNELAELDQKTKLFRVFEVTVIPGLLQTPGYARARFAEGIRRLKVPNDLNEAVQGRMARQGILHRPDKRFHFVLTEAALRYRLCSSDVMLSQLGHLISFTALPNVRLGIIDFDTQYVTSPWHGFWIYDNEKVLVETMSAALDLRQPEEIELYSGAFEQLAAVASYGRSARAIITRAIDDLEPEVSDGSE